MTRALARRLSDYKRLDSVGSTFRARRIHPLLDFIATVHRERGSVEILDIGGTREYWNILPLSYLLSYGVRVTILNTDVPSVTTEGEPFRYLKGDGCDLSAIADQSYDIGHSNSVIEHVGDWGRMVQFANEISRVAVRLFVQTPNYWFPIEPHCMTPFFHWLPKPVRLSLLLRFELGHWERATSVDEAMRTLQSARLLDRRMFASLFSDATKLTERVWCIPKSFVALRV